MTHRDWELPLAAPAMASGTNHRIGLTSRYLTRKGEPWFPVSGELHFTRVPRESWRRRLRAMRNGGVNTVATYLFWNHHQPERDQPPSFEGDRDISAFLDLCVETGLEVVLRIGPWCHGEVRNGGFPDWVQEAGVSHRSDDPAYLALVAPWFAALADQLSAHFEPGSPVIGIQVENELYDQPAHIATLKRMAVAAGLRAPLWMATAWGGAVLPEDEVLPMYGGYADGFWTDATAPWDVSFREHFFFRHVWDDPGIGADLRAPGLPGPESRSPSTVFPPVTCELGGGMATAYHRRPVLDAEDIAAVANVKLGNGSAWQGYYMYAGGRNPGLGLQESHATGYPNDLPQIDYDFHAPIGAAGQPTRTHALLRQQHAFLAAVGDRLVQMPSTLPDRVPADAFDAETPRWAIRSDGECGFVFVNRRQPHEALGPSAPVAFAITLPGSTLTFPDEPIAIPPGTIARFPFGLQIGRMRLDWATANLLTLLDRPGGGRVAVLAALPGISAWIAVGGAVSEADPDRVRAFERGQDAVVVLPADLAEQAWVIDGVLYTSADELDVDESGVLTWDRTGGPVARFDTEHLRFDPLTPAPGPAAVTSDLHVALRRPAAEPPVDYGASNGRASAPPLEQVFADGARYDIAVPDPLQDDDFELTIEWIGDVAVAEADGVLLTDRFWDGTLWTITVPAGTAEVTVHVLPLHPQAPIWLHPDARRALAETSGQGVLRALARPVRARRHAVDGSS
ncbi:beta-galactosidase [Glycomyces tritici]|uniref:Beta-galactosidase n=1 Tax=Glycomyces tritici TaxID=2665176 RepID=A0ABT7YWT7_9ACTN|nr:beta-galactosidase [Glycomyces tritici]MDN3243090.1 beta-galactosidase [Glycomyces tritici]